MRKTQVKERKTEIAIESQMETLVKEKIFQKIV